MRLLLDSHAFLWFMLDAPNLSRAAREAIIEAEDAYVMAAKIKASKARSYLRNLAINYFNQNDEEKLRKLYKRIHKIDPSVAGYIEQMLR